MPVSPSYPGIYIEELPSTSHTIAAAPTSIAVFVGYTHPFKTPSSSFNKAIELFSFTDYEREFGGFYNGALLDDNVAQAVNQFFINGGGQAYVVGLKAANYFNNSGGALTPTLAAGSATLKDDITFTALEPTDPTEMQISIDGASSIGDSANVTINYGSRPPEIYRNVSINEAAPPTIANPDFIGTRMSNAKLVSVSVGANSTFVAATDQFTPNVTASKTINNVTFTALDASQSTAIQIVISNVRAAGKIADIEITSGSLPSDPLFTNVSVDATINSPNPDFILTRMIASAYVNVALGPNPKLKNTTAPVKVQFSTPVSAITTFDATQFHHVFDADTDLDKLPIFNILVLPGVTDNSVLSEALAFAERKRAFMIVDPPPGSTADQDAVHGINEYMTGPASPKSPNGALYFPYLKTSDPLSGKPISLPPSGYVAGIFARTDNNRGVWKAPAGLETTVLNTTGVVDDGRMNDMRQGVLNLAGINCLRTFPGVGTVVFGSRTLVSANVAYEQWKYVPVRRMALFIEQTLYSNLTWAVFEPNDEPLWIALRTSVENFMLSLFSNGAFQGSKPSEAFLVRCDKSTTTQTDINNGVVNIIVAFAPLKPAEFVIVKIAQLAGQGQ
ncbi:MAG TPA: phage tail sheath subtilisin-like domain-containing protein [Thermoanaerobaculia bacterium]|jgi:phage tail sheath protein FI|nr:phage tail sheath subtilisin-like domain-containing protein [Thermoanaerobaculia bacterium]